MEFGGTPPSIPLIGQHEACSHLYNNKTLMTEARIASFLKHGHGEVKISECRVFFDEIVGFLMLPRTVRYKLIISVGFEKKNIYIERHKCVFLFHQSQRHYLLTVDFGDGCAWYCHCCVITV